jgi:hypothetical protein
MSWIGTRSRKIAKARKAYAISLILREYVNKPRLGTQSIHEGQEVDHALDITLRFFTEQPKFLYYEAATAISQINALKSTTERFLKDLDNLHPEVQNAVSSTLQTFNSKKSLISRYGANNVNSVAQIKSVITDLQKTLNKRLDIYETQNLPTIRKGRGRPNNQQAYDVAEMVAIYFFHHKGRLPGTGTNAKLSPFQRCVTAMFKELDIKADSRRACERILSKLRKKK